MSQSLARALHILVELGRGPAGLDQLAEATGVHKTTVLRMLRTLADERFVFRDGHHRYHVGSRIFELSSRALDQREVRSIAAPHLAAFNRPARADHTPGGAGRARRRLRGQAGVPRSDPDVLPHRTARAAALLGGGQGAAGRPARRRRSTICCRTWSSLRATANTITDAVTLLAELAAVRAQGWARDQGGERAVDQLPGGARPRRFRSGDRRRLGLGARRRPDL